MSERLPVPYSERNLTAGQPDARRDESNLRSLICHVGRLMHEARYVSGLAGSISARLNTDHILITPSGLAKGFLQPDQLVVYDLEGKALWPEAESMPMAADVLMHIECYRQRPDVQGVVRAHPPTAVALTIAGVSMRTCVVPEAVVTLGLVPTAAFSVPTSAENREAIRVLIAQHDAVLLAYDGSLTVGADVWQAYLRLETLEHTATVLHRTAQLGPIAPLPPAEVAKLLQLRRQLGYWRPGDEERFCQMCGVC